MRVKTLTAIVLSVGVGVSAWLVGRGVSAQDRENPQDQGPVATSAAVEQPLTTDPYQRSAEIYAYQTSAKSGPQRGEELYYYKCWFCHNQYAKTGPQLRDLYKRATLDTGQPVNDRAVAEKIGMGGPEMPAFRYALKPTDMADLLSYIKSDKCCFDAENPPPNPRFVAGHTTATALAAAAENSPPSRTRSLSGGACGLVESAKGEPLEGIGVQLITPQTAIRTTVYTNEQGRYEFPVLEAGTYTLRIARPLEFKPYVKESVHIDGATQLDKIVLERVSDTEFLPSTPEVLSQLTSVEWLMNLPGTGQEKKLFSNRCTHCHSYQQIFRNRFDEASWGVIVRRMMRGRGSPLINVNPSPSPAQVAQEEILTKWLGRIRGPEATDPPGLAHLPFTRGASARVVITEYELPRELLAPHDVYGDKRGNICYTAHRSPWSGVLDPRTGKVAEYRIPAKQSEETAGALPGTHHVWVDKNDVVWWSEQWDHYLTGQDARTGEIIKRYSLIGNGAQYTINNSGFSNFAMDENGYAYETGDDATMMKVDTRTGHIQKFPFPKHIQGTYDNIITPDGRYWSGGGGDFEGVFDTTTGEYWEYPARTPFVSYSRGAVDRDGNFWNSGRGSGLLVKLDMKTRHLYEYNPPVPYATLYEAMPDKNGEVWAAPIQSGIMFRFNPRTERWIGYRMPEPYSHDRRTWIDNSTDPVTVWYVDHNGYMVRIQPLD